MDFFQGERVRCLGKADWGTGFVVADSRNGKVRVRFQNGGVKLLALKHAKLMKVKPPRPLPPPAWLAGRFPNYFQPLPSIPKPPRRDPASPRRDVAWRG